MHTTTCPARPDFTVAGNQPTIDKFTALALRLAEEIGPDFAAGVRTAGWRDRPDSFEGFTIHVPAGISGVDVYRVIDRIRDEVARVHSTSTFTDSDGRSCAFVQVDHLPAQEQAR